MNEWIDALLAAAVRIEGLKPASGYLVTSNRVATCHHVVNLWEEGEKCDVTVGNKNPERRKAWVLRSNRVTDCAILALDEPVTATPLAFGQGLTAECVWDTFGFPHNARGGIRFTGEVQLASVKDETGFTVIQLFSKMAAAGQGTPLVGLSGSPVVVNGAVVGHVVSIVGDPDSPTRPAFGTIHAIPISAVEALLDQTPKKSVIEPARLIASAEGGFAESVQRGISSGIGMLAVTTDTTLRSAKILMGQNRPDLALKLLGAATPSLEAMQQTALALAKAGQIDESIVLLDKLISEGARDPETRGLLSGRYKDKWRKSGKTDRAALIASYGNYKKVFEETKNPFNGINAAATALYLGETAEAAVLANQTIQSLQDHTDLDHWDLATLGEAWLLVGKLERAAEFYQKAVALAPNLYQDIAVMRRQARLDLEYLGKPRDSLDKALPVPGILAFAGHMVDDLYRPVPRFPKSKVRAVRLAIRSHLQKLGFVQGFATAARGSDILFLEEMVGLGVRPIVVLPFPEADFRAISVGEEWGERLDSIRSSLEIMVLASEVPLESERQAAFVRSNKKIQKLATEHASRLDEMPRLLVVWDGKQDGDGPGGTADTIRLWQDDGYDSIVIDINALDTFSAKP